MKAFFIFCKFHVFAYEKALGKPKALSGSEGRIRTNDTRIMIPLL